MAPVWTTEIVPLHSNVSSVSETSAQLPGNAGITRVCDPGNRLLTLFNSPRLFDDLAWWRLMAKNYSHTTVYYFLAQKWTYARFLPRFYPEKALMTAKTSKKPCTSPFLSHFFAISHQTRCRMVAALNRKLPHGGSEQKRLAQTWLRPKHAACNPAWFYV